jgi:exonuclease III
VKVATFNINNINKRLDNLLAWLAKAEPDVVSLQELKAEQEAFPVNALRTAGYEAVWQGERSWNAVATFLFPSTISIRPRRVLSFVKPFRFCHMSVLPSTITGS